MDNIDMQNDNNEFVKTRKGTALFVTAGWFAAVLSLFIYPFVFGIIGVILGIVASKSGSRAGLPVIVASIVFMGIGLIFSEAILNNIGRLLTPRSL